MPWPLRDEAVQEWLGGEAVEALADGRQQRIDALYEHIAATTGGSDEPFFAEKSNLRVSSVAAELYPNGRELFLVRDFRDMVCSVLAFNEKRGVTGFGRAEASSDMEYVERLGGWAASLMRAWERRRERAHLVRYEDLVLDPERSACRPARPPRRGLERRDDRGHAGQPHRGDAGAAGAPDQRLGPELDRALAHGARAGAERGLRAGLRPGAGAVRLRAHLESRSPKRDGICHGTFTCCRNKPVRSR